MMPGGQEGVGGARQCTCCAVDESTRLDADRPRLIAQRLSISTTDCCGEHAIAPLGDSHPHTRGAAALLQRKLVKAGLERCDDVKGDIPQQFGGDPVKCSF